MDAATVAQLGSGEPTVMHGEADTVEATKQGARRAAKTRIRTRIAHVGSEYRSDVTSGTCELCIAEWTARSRNIAVDARRKAAAHDEAPTSCRRGRGTGLARPGHRTGEAWAK